MQTFLPYPDLRLSCQLLDDRRLGKQRVEAFQILRALTWSQYAWKNHPAVRMWRGFVPALVEYGLAACREWTRRGHADTVAQALLDWSGGRAPRDAPLPLWFGLQALHRSHRCALLRKDPHWYGPLFAALGHGDEPDDPDYLWPPAVFPRWPVRGGPTGVDVAEAARLLGVTSPHPWQVAAVDQLACSRDVLLAASPGSGGTTTGLLAGLSGPGRTVWVAPWDGPVAGPPPAYHPPPPARAPLRRRDPPPSTARPPGPDDVLAMRAEGAPPEFLFVHPDRLPALPDDVTLVVVDRAQELSAADWVAVAKGTRGRPRLLIVAGADDVRRLQLVAAAGLDRPAHLDAATRPSGPPRTPPPRTPGAVDRRA